MQSIFLVALFVAFASAHDPKLVCTPDGILGPSPAAGKAIGSCKDPAVWGTEPGKKNPNCDGNCIAEVFGYLGDDGKVSKDLYFKWIDNDFNVELRDFAKKHMTGCFEKFGDKIDVNDATCTEVKKFDTCGWEMQKDLKCKV